MVKSQQKRIELVTRHGFTQADFSKANTKHETRLLTKEEFRKSAVCCLLGHKPDLTALSGSHPEGKILMVKVSQDIKKMMGIGQTNSTSSPAKEKKLA